MKIENKKRNFLIVSQDSLNLIQKCENSLIFHRNCGNFFQGKMCLVHSQRKKERFVNIVGSFLNMNQNVTLGCIESGVPSPKSKLEIKDRQA